jgi:hypothetical protein
MDNNLGLIAGVTVLNGSRRSITANAPLVVTINNVAANPQMSPQVAQNVDYGLFVYDSFNNPLGPLFVVIWPNYGTFIFLQNNDFIGELTLAFTAQGIPYAQVTGSTDPNIIIVPAVTMEFAGIPRLLIDVFAPFRSVDVVSFNIDFSPSNSTGGGRPTYTLCLGNVLKAVILGVQDGI